MAPDTTVPEKLTISLSPDARDMLREMIKFKYGNRMRVTSLMIEELVRDKYLWYTKEVKEQAR